MSIGKRCDGTVNVSIPVVGENDLVYLASPYTSKDPNATNSELVQAHRAEQVSAVAAALSVHGINIYCPIAHGHAMNRYASIGPGWKYWEKLGLRMLKCCDQLWVLMLPGWEDSEGVKAEIAEAERLGIPVAYINPEEIVPGIIGKGDRRQDIYTIAQLSHLMDRVVRLPATEQMILLRVFERQVKRLEDGQRRYGTGT